MEETNIINTGNTGLLNLGNTCFLNSCLQVLCHTKELTNILCSENIENVLKKDLPDSGITYLWKELQDAMYNNNGIISPKPFVFGVHRLAKIKKRDLFTGWAQNDISEFLLFMVDCMHNSLSRGIEVKIEGSIKNKKDKLAVECFKMIKEIYKKDYSEMMKLFYGIYVSVLTPPNKKTILNCKPEHFFILDLPIPLNIEVPTIYDCFDLYCKPELLEKENAWYNEDTGKKESVMKKITFWSLPDILVITLNRFSALDGEKLNTLVNFPLKTLDLSRYVDGYNASSYKYELYGVCNHAGGLMGGHYTAFVLNESKQWLWCNDATVNIVLDSSQIISPYAYCLFYRKKNN